MIFETENKMKANGFLAERETKRMSLDIETVKLNGVFSGYASVFNAVDQGKDAVAAGAFRKSLQNRKPSDVRMLFQHDPDQPLGIWKTIQEDEKGLFVEGQIASGVKRSEEVLHLMRAGAIDGLSIGFKTKRARVNPTTKVRWILEADLWEISIVTFPLLDAARIDDVKSSQCSDLPSIRDIERWLRRDAGLSRGDAKCLLANGYHALGRKHNAAACEPLAGKIRRATQTIKSGI